jgi:hypothetical protein
MTTDHQNPHAQDSKIPHFERWNLRNLGWNLGPAPFTSATPSCYIECKPRGPVRKNTTSEAVATPTDKRGFVMPKFLGLVRLFAPAYGLRGMVGAIRKDARTASDVFLTTMLHQLRVRTHLVATLNPEGAKTMTAISQQASRRAASITGTPDPIQLHAQAQNALSMAIHYLRQPEANVAGARRKAVQALSALRGLDLSLEG